MQIKFDIRGVEEIQAFLKALPRGVVSVAMPAIAEWMIGTPQRGLKHYQAYKYVSRKRAYGQTFSSDKQRRYVMAMIREGRIDPGYPHRTGRTQRGYVMKVSNDGYRVSIQNKEAGAYYTRDDSGQARLNALAGWVKVRDVISNNMAGAFRHARTAVSAYLKKGR